MEDKQEAKDEWCLPDQPDSRRTVGFGKSDPTLSEIFKLESFHTAQVFSSICNRVGHLCMRKTPSCLAQKVPELRTFLQIFSTFGLS